VRRPLAAVLGIVLSVGVWTASATAATGGSSTVPQSPAPTSVDHVAVSCAVPPPPVVENPAPGATVLSFTILPRGCPVP
jgi:hypothetical protein